MTGKFLNVPFRRSRSISLGESLREYLEKEFHQTSTKVKKDCESIERLRNKALDIQSHISSLDNLFE